MKRGSEWWRWWCMVMVTECSILKIGHFHFLSFFFLFLIRFFLINKQTDVQTDYKGNKNCCSLSRRLLMMLLNCLFNFTNRLISSPTTTSIQPNPSKILEMKNKKNKNSNSCFTFWLRISRIARRLIISKHWESDIEVLPLFHLFNF